MCSICLPKLYKNPAFVECPTCRQISRVRLDEIPKNRDILEFLEFFKSQNSSDSNRHNNDAAAKEVLLSHQSSQRHNANFLPPPSSSSSKSSRPPPLPLRPPPPRLARVPYRNEIRIPVIVDNPEPNATRNQLNQLDYDQHNSHHEY